MPLYYINGRRAEYGDDKGGDHDDDRNLYGRRHFERLGREEDNRDKSAAMSSAATVTMDWGKHGGGNGSRGN